MDEKKEHVTMEKHKEDVRMVSWGPTDIVFCGNPGVGKSTLLSSISGCHFESGISFGAGLTSKLKFHIDQHNKDLRWADTPGLADIEMAEIAAKAINEALEDASKSNRKVKIFFVVTAESGRIRPADHFTINQVIGCMKVTDEESKDNKYGVIVNKCNWLNRKRLAEKGIMKLTAVFNQKSSNNTFSTNFVTFLPMVPELDLADNKRYCFKYLRAFIGQVPGIESIKSVTKIDTRNMKEQLQDQATKYKLEMDKLTNMIEKQEKEFLAGQAEQKRQFEQVLNKQKLMMERQARQMERQRMEGERKFQKELNDLKEKQTTANNKQIGELIATLEEQNAQLRKDRAEEQERHEQYMRDQASMREENEGICSIL